MASCAPPTPASLPASGRRFAHLWLPRLASERILGGRRPSAPLVLAAMEKNALRLSALDETAAAQGLEVGMTLADARARVPRLHVADADPTADLKLMLRLLEACRRFTPSLALHPPDALDLDITGCAHLFGGEARLLMAAAALMRRFGLTLRSAVADTAALACAAARFGRGGVVAPGVREAALAPLPVEALRLPADGCAVLRQLGFKRIGQLLELPRASLSRRLGAEALHRLDQALGRRADPLELRLEPPPPSAERRLFEPISEADQVLAVVGHLADDLCTTLEGRGLGGRGFLLELFRVDGAVRRLQVAASRPLRQAAPVVALFAERLAGLDEGLQADFGFDQLRLRALGLQPMQAAALDLLDDAGADGALEALVDRIAARTGSTPHRQTLRELHRPEAASKAAPLGQAAALDVPLRFLDAPLRPLRLFHPPQPLEATLAGVPEEPPARFVWRRVERRIVRAEGPERIEPEWARDAEPQAARDYYRLEDDHGRRYWVFRLGRYDIAPVPPPRSEEELRPDHAPPRPAPRLALVHPRPSPPPADEAAPSSPRQGLVALSAQPAWFLHGLFG